MSRPIHCNCLCHGSDGNFAGDLYWACKNCYAANHMGGLPRQSHEQAPEKRKPRKPRVQKPTGTVEAVAAAAKSTNG